MISYHKLLWLLASIVMMFAPQFKAPLTLQFPWLSHQNYCDIHTVNLLYHCTAKLNQFSNSVIMTLTALEIILTPQFYITIYEFTTAIKTVFHAIIMVFTLQLLWHLGLNYYEIRTENYYICCGLIIHRYP
jgi:hypothetical protein